MGWLEKISVISILLFPLFLTFDFYSGEDIKDKEAKVLALWILPENLLEISGFCRMDENRVACIQDEKGVVFIYNFLSCEVERQVPFGPDGDYEDISFSQGIFYVLRSDGVIFCISETGRPSPRVTQHDLPLNIKTDVEGLCLDPSGKRLLVVVKSPVPEMEKPVYEITLPGLKLNKNPAYKIRFESFIRKEAAANPKKVKEKGFSDFSSDLAKDFLFASIAIHPRTGDLYLTDGEHSKLIVADRQGEVKTVYKLDSDYLPKSEGISFMPSGELFISSEGENKKPGVIARVKIL